MVTALADVNRLLDHARIRLPGALDAAVLFEMFALMNNFFQDTNCWTQDISFPVVSTSAVFEVNPSAFTYNIVPTYGSINQLMWVRDDNGRPVNAGMPIPGAILLRFSPSQAATYTARVALTVSDPVDANGFPVFPDWVLNKYGTDILDGLLGRMMGQLAKPYTNQQLSMLYVKQFRSATLQAKVEAQRQNTYRGQAWAFPQAFRVRQTRSGRG